MLRMLKQLEPTFQAATPAFRVEAMMGQHIDCYRANANLKRQLILDNGQVRASSILFGLRSYDAAKEVIAIALRNHALSAFTFEVRLLDGSLLHASSITIERDALVIRDSMAGTVQVAVADLAQIKRAR